MAVDFEKLRQAFQAALEKRPPGQGEACPDRASAGDEELRRQVALLLKAHAEGRGPLDRGVFGEGQTALYPSQEEQPGTQIGPYKLLQQIGEGGMGVVFLAEQQEPVRRQVALKVVKAGMDSAQVLARFEAERQALALMDHPNIARVLDAGATAGGRPYFILELVKGVPITQFCDDHQLTPRQRLELFLPVCQAVQHAHQKGVIHRDLKPTNILVALYDDRPVPKVIDFGVAKAMHRPLTEKTLFTQLGSVVGTFEYMSPEQAQLNALDVDTRSDVYSLGVLLYELLTGTTPLERTRLKGAALDDLLRSIREEDPPRPSTRLSSSQALPAIAARRRTEPARLTKLLRGELDWIAMKALEKDRTRRYETANGLARDLQRYLAEEPVEACPPSAGYRLRKFARKHRTLLATAAAFAALLATAAAVSSCLAVWAMQAEQGATAAKQAAGERAREAQSSADRLRENERVLRSSLYASRSALIQASWDADNVGRAADLLELQRPGPGEPDLRGFEWYYWNRLCHADRRTLRVFGPVGKGEACPSSTVGPLMAPVFSRDGRYLATPLGRDHGLHVAVLETATGEVRRTLKATELLDGERAVCALAFTLDGGSLAGAVSVTADPEAGKPHSGRFEMRQFQVGDDGKAPPPRPGVLPLPRHIIKVWEVTTGKERASIAGALNVGAVALSPDAARVAVSGATGSGPRADQEIQVWSVAGKKLLTLSGGSPEGGLLFSPDGTRLAAPFRPRGNTDPQAYRLKVWDAGSGKELLALSPRGNITSGDLAFSPDCKRLAAGVSPHFLRGAGPQLWQVQVWDAVTGRELLSLKRNAAEGATNTPPASPVAFSPDGSRLASVEDGTIIQIWDATSGEPLQVLKGHRGAVEALAFSLDGAELYSAEMSLIKSWDASTPDRHVRLPGFQKEWHHLNCATPDYTRIVTAVGLEDPDPDAERTAYYLSDLTGKNAVQLDMPDAAGLGLTWRNDGKQLGGVLTLSVRKGPIEARVWDGATGKVLHHLRGGQGKRVATWSNPVFRSDGNCIVAVVLDVPGREIRRLLQVWNVTGERELFSTETNYNGINAVTLSPDGRRLAAWVSRQTGDAGSEDVRLWDVATGREARVLPIPRNGLSDLVFSPDGTRLVAHLYGQSPPEVEQALVWDTATGDVVCTLKGHAGVGSSSAFSPDGRRIVSCSARFGRENEAKIHLWDAATGDELATLPVEAACYSVEFSPDGHRLIAVTERGAGLQQAGVAVFRPDQVTKTGEALEGSEGEVLRMWDATPRPEVLPR